MKIMLKVKNINTAEDAKNYIEGCINDFEHGISTKKETLRYLGQYTNRIMDLFWDNALKEIRENPDKYLK